MLFVLEKCISCDGNIGCCSYCRRCSLQLFEFTSWLEGGMLVWCLVFGVSLDNVGGGCVCFGKNVGALGFTLLVALSFDKSSSFSLCCNFLFSCNCCCGLSC